MKAVPQQAANGPAADYPVVLGDPFTVDGKTFTPVDSLNYDAVGLAVSGSDGGGAISAAHRTLPLPSYAEVTSLETGRTILVRIERRGPMTGSALVELSPGAIAQLGATSAAGVNVRLRRTNPIEPERALLRSGQPVPVRMDTPKSLLAVLQRKLDQQGGAVLKPITVAAAAPAEALPKIVPAPVIASSTALTAPVAKKPEPKLPKQAATAKPPVKPASSNWFVQIGTFASKANAEAAAKKSGGSFHAVGSMWRVRVGPFVDADKARPVLAKLKVAGYKDAVIQRAG